MDASVPIPCFSMRPMSSDSVINPGGLVVPSLMVILSTGNCSPILTLAMYLSDGLDQGMTSKNPLSTREDPDEVKNSPPIS